MALIEDRYAKLLKSLLPPGRAWDSGAGAVFSKLLSGFAEELARIEERSTDLLNEVDPRTSVELLQEWERVVRIPDDFQDVSSDIKQRRSDILRKLSARGGQNAAFYVELASLFGYEVYIEDCFEFRAGHRIGRRIYGEDFTFYWRVVAPNYTPVYFRAGSSIGSRLAEFRDELLELVIRASAPAHTHVLFTYGGS